MKRIIIISLLLNSFITVFGQINVVQRVEVPNWGGGFDVTPLKNKRALTAYFRDFF